MSVIHAASSRTFLMHLMADLGFFSQNVVNLRNSCVIIAYIALIRFLWEKKDFSCTWISKKLLMGINCTVRLDN